MISLETIFSSVKCSSSLEISILHKLKGSKIAVILRPTIIYNIFYELVADPKNELNYEPIYCMLVCKFLLPMWGY